MNEISKHEEHLPAETDKNPFEQYAADGNRNRIVGKLLRFSGKTGLYHAGLDEEEIPLGTELIAIMDELHVGWIKWQDARPVDGVMGRVAEGYRPSRRADLDATDSNLWERDPDSGVGRDPWQPTNSIIFKELLGNQLYTFNTSSKGGIGAVLNLSGEYGKHLRSKPDDYPVIVLHSSSYKHNVKSRGTIHVPVFTIIEWSSKAPALAALAGIEEEPDAVEEEPPPPPPRPAPKPTYKPEGRAKPRF